MDDYGRSIDGYAWGGRDFGRFSSSLISYLINAKLQLSDISPWPQIIAIALVAISSCMLLYAFCGKKPSKASIAISCLLGLAPSTISLLVFKFDAPCVALGILATCIPLLLVPSADKKRWFVCVVISQLVVWTTYQALSGAFISLLILKLLVEYVRGNVRVRSCIKYLLTALLACAAAVLMFYTIGKIAHVSGYRSTEVAFGVALTNVVKYSKAAADLLTRSQKILFCLFALMAFLACVKRRMSAKVYPIAIVASIMSFICALGAYIFLAGALTNARSMIGYSLWCTGFLLCCGEAFNRKWPLVASVMSIVLAYTAIIFPLAFGNALAAQQVYSIQRNSQLASDMLAVLPSGKSRAYKLNIVGDIGMAPEMAHVYNLFPATKYIFDVQSGLSCHSAWGYKRIINYYGGNITELDSLPANWNGRLVSSNDFQDIRLKGNVISVELKTAGGRAF